MEKFRPLETFESPEMRSIYEKGLIYTVRTPELATMLKRWLSEGRVEIVETQSGMSGHGVVYGSHTPLVDEEPDS